MSVWRLAGREIAFRKLDFALGVLAALVAVGCLVAVMTLLRAHGQRLEELTEAKVEETAALMASAKDDYRKMMKGLGYNIVVMSQDQERAQYFADGYASIPMPEEFVTRLCASDIRSVQHLLPMLHQKTAWPERDDYPIMLIGVRGEVPHAHSNRKAALLAPVEPGTMRIGSVVHEDLGLDVGDTAVLMGQEFKVSQVNPERGNEDDISVWVHLAAAQKMLGQEGRVSTILALSCFCAGSELEKVRGDVAAILPEAQVIQRAAQAEARANARGRVGALAEETTEQEAAYHARLAKEREAFAAWLAPLAVVVATIWIGLLALGNVRERRTEIGIWRALGFRSSQILAVFLSKAVLVGLTGALLGYAAGFALGLAWGALEGVPLDAGRIAGLFSPLLFAAVLALAPIQACIASWAPAMLAVQQDPATVLREE